jgi:hypothetical protein
MAAVTSISSNATGLKIAEETTPKVLPGSPDWDTLEPNTYADFGAQIGTTARNPLNTSRQRKKGVTTSLNASGGFNTDLTQENLQRTLQGFLYADLRTKSEKAVSSITTTDTYNIADSGADYTTATLLFAKNFDNAENNGLKTVASSTATTVVVNETLVNETPSSSRASISRVGIVGGAGDLDVDVTGTFPAITSTVLDFTTLGLIPGEFIFIGGDSAGVRFTNAVNNGFKRVKSVAANLLTLDKSDSDMVVEASTTETIEIYFGRCLKNEADPTLQVTRTYTLERTLGAPDDAQPSQIQADGLEGTYANEVSINLPPEDKVTLDLGFVALDGITVDGPTALPSASGTTFPVAEASAFNTSSDFTRLRLAKVDSTDEAPVPLFAFIEELTLTINNNVAPNPALAVLGAAVVSKGNFEVGGQMTGFFQDTVAISAVRNNDNLTLDAALVKENAGVVLDIPLLTLGDGRPTIEQNVPVKLPLSNEAATGALVDTNFDHTLFICFFDYLPDLAE